MSGNFSVGARVSRQQLKELLNRHLEVGQLTGNAMRYYDNALLIVLYESALITDFNSLAVASAAPLENC